MSKLATAASQDDHVREALSHAVVRGRGLTQTDASNVSSSRHELNELRRSNEQLLCERNTALAVVLGLQHALAAEREKVSQLMGKHGAHREPLREILPARVGRKTIRPRNASQPGVPSDGGVRKDTGVDELRKKLWGGFSRYALPELERLRMDPAAPRSEQVEAAWSLAKWHYVLASYTKALEQVRFAKAHAAELQMQYLLAEIQCLLALARAVEADVLIDEAMRNDVAFKRELLLLKSTARRHIVRVLSTREEAETVQLSFINEGYLDVAMAPITKKDPFKPLSISNIVANLEAPLEPPGEPQEKISIVMPAFNAEPTIGWVIECLLQQTWQNLEIIVVDDVSTDGTRDIVSAIAARDPRVRLVTKTVNEGPYCARNVGVEHATGQFITVHDTDDWSHPQKLEIQMAALVADGHAVAVISSWIRVKESLEIVGSWSPKGSLYDINYSSLLFRRELLDTAGRWDEVRVGADSEFYSRLLALYGKGSIVEVPQRFLLSLALAREGSLTRSAATHARSLFYGVRRNYRDSYRHWHKSLTEAKLANAVLPERKFPIPVGNDAKKAGGRHTYDLVVVADLAIRGGAFTSTLNYVLAARQAGQRVALFHWRKYSLRAYSPLSSRVYEVCNEHSIDLLSSGDTVETDLILIGCPAMLQHQPDAMPAIAAREVIVIVNQFASRLTNNADEQYDPRVARSHLLNVFGKEGVWIPISGVVRQLVQEDPRYPPLHEQTWSPMIDPKTWCKSLARWRGDQRERPVVGRHCIDAHAKWPADAEVLAQAYGIGTDWDVRFLGGATHAVKTLGGELPSNWHVLPFDGTSVYRFLSDLDFFVHYPHEHSVEEFGSAAMEAMAVGIPVILPPQFEEIFGAAAVYAIPKEVHSTISRLWSSPEAYVARVAAGREFVMKHCDANGFLDRLQELNRSLASA